MYTIYILAAFVLGLFCGWLINFILSGKYVEKAIAEYYSEEARQELKKSVNAQNRRFKISTLIWIVIVLAVFLLLAFYASGTTDVTAQKLDKANNAEVFDGIVNGMKQFLRH